ncbi:MAG: hypothetical protein JXR10_08120 [Cyclobacteriaceae bacterium]
MKELTCKIIEHDRFYKELITEFIDQTEGLILAQDSDRSCDIVFADFRSNTDEKLDSLGAEYLVVISSDQGHIHSYFKNEITDYLFKPDLTFERFSKTIEKINAIRTASLIDKKSTV